MLRSALLRSRISKKIFSSISFSASPREVIVSNILKLTAINKATDDASLDASLRQIAIDPHNLPEEVQGLEHYLLGANTAVSEKFSKDPTAWQNLPFWESVALEVGRLETWPFLVGGLVGFLIFCVAVPRSLSKEGAKKSHYISLIEGRRGKLEDAH